MFAFIRLSVVLLLIRIFGVRSEDVFIMSEYVCMTNSSLPIISNSPLKDIRHNDYLYVNDNMYKNFDNGECGEYCSGTWKIEDSISVKNSEIIMDRRWEDLNPYFLRVEDKKLYFEPTYIEIPKNDFKIPMSIRGKEIHIFFCTGKTVTSKCVWFILQGWQQTKSAIRQCNENEIPTEYNKYPQNECKRVRNEIFHTNETLFLFENHWSHIFVQKQNNKWSIIHNNTTIISFEASDSDPHYKNLILQAKTINALVKIHYYKYLSVKNEINERWGPKITPNISCLKFFFKMCLKCSVKITFQVNKETIFDQEYKEPKWKEITINLPKRDLDGTFYFHTKSNGVKSPFWAIDNISICPKNDVRTISRHPEANCELVDGFGSQKLYQETYKKAKINTESICKDDQLGFDSCFPCTRSICGPKKYCQFNFPELKCACPPGSSVFNDKCKKCNDGYYGFGCRKTCSGCQKGCEYNGKCNDGYCNPFWRGDSCDTPTYPIFVNTPDVQDITPTTAKFIFNNFTVLGDGKESVYRYLIQLKEKSSLYWESIYLGSIGTNYNNVYEKLKPETTYLVRAIVDHTYNNPIDKHFEFNTTCKDIERNQIDVKPYNTSVNLEFKLNSENCNITKYSINGTNINANTYRIKNLEPNTDYEFNIKGGNDITIKNKTLEGLPSPVENIQVDKITSNSAFVSWKVPKKPHGKILGYRVIYLAQNSREFECRNLQNTEIFNEKTTETEKLLRDLKPYMVYVVKVIPFTGAGDGIETSIHCETLQTDTISKPDYGLLPNQEDIVIQFKLEKCKQEGPFFASSIITCLSKWCQNETSEEAIKDISYDGELVIRRLIPYTDYDVQVNLSRFSDGRNAYLIRENITTLESTPNEIRDLSVYSIIPVYYGKNKVSFRWLPPWPPLSRINHFQINYSYQYFGTKLYSLECVNSPCKIWKDYICCTINEDIYFGYKYTFKVTAVNSKKQESPSKELTHKIEKQTTRVPYNVITEWNDENKLKLSWNHPNFTYGPITYFEYQINGISDKIYIRKKNLTYTKDNIDVELEKEIIIKIKACNTECSYNTVKKDFSPPPKAEIPNEIESMSFNNSIKVTLPDIKKICRNCQTVILLAIVTENNKTADFAKNIIFEYGLDHKEKTFLIGNDTKFYSKYLNKTISNSPLKSGSYYNLSIRAINTYKNRRSVKTAYYRVYTTKNPNVHLDIPKKSEKSNSNMAYIALIILPIIVAGILIYLKWKGKPIAVSEVENIPLHSFAQKRAEVLNLIPTSSQSKKSFAIAFLDFEVYLKRSLENGTLEEQYENSITYLFNPSQNVEKERIMGYPVTKISCEDLNYLLAEAPTENTVNLLLKIVWQQNVSVIVGIVDDENEGKMLCPEIYQSRTVEGLTVTSISEESPPYLTLKRLKIAVKNKEKEICYVQLSNWKHSATFLYLNVVSLLKILNTFNNSKNQNILIYSGNEYSPSDIIIMSDICLKMALRDNHIDALKYFSIIKEKHNRFLDNFEKYKIVYLLILESMFRISTNIPYENNFKEKIDEIISNNLEAQFKYLKDTEWIDEFLRSESVSPIYTELLEFQTRTMADRSKYQIENFVNITGLLNKNHLYTMQEPNENQNEGFWRFIVDSNTNVIVVIKRLDDEDNNIFWPQKNEVITIDSTIAITFVKSVKFNGYELISLNIRVQQNQFPITLYVFSKWKIIDSVPMEFKDAVSFITESASTLNKSDAIVFTCWNGNSGCGLFAGLYFLIEAIKSTKSCDVCHTVRYIRNFNRHFIKNKKQFKFLYEASLESMLNFLIYDNMN